MAEKETRVIEIVANGVQAKNTINDLGRASRKLRSDLRNMSPLDNDYDVKLKRLQEINGRMSDLTKNLRNHAASWDQIKRQAKGILIGTIGAGIFQSMAANVTSNISQIKRGVIELSDEISDIEKTTGLTKETAEDLNAEFKEFDTRTARSELRKLAVQAGKLGYDTKEGVKDFVEQANIITVALKEDLGEDAIPAISKASKQFHESMTDIASGINAVGQASEAKESYLVNFLSRLAPLGETIGIMAGDVMGYGAALDVAGIRVEMGSTALNKTLIDFTKNTEDFGKAAGFAKGELTQLAQSQGINEAFLQFLDRLKKANPESDKFLQKLEDLGIDGDRASMVFMSLANNIDVVRSNQELANVEIQKGTSVIDEYDKKNNNLAATSEKLTKKMKSVWMDGSIRSGIEKGINLTYKYFDAIVQFGKILLWATVIWGTYKVVTWAATAAQTKFFATILGGNRLLAIQQIALTAQGFALKLLTLNLKGARREWQLLSGLLNKNPLGLAVTVIMTAVAAYKLFNKHQKKSVEHVDKMKASAKELNAQLQKDVAVMKSKFEQLLRTNPQDKRRLDLINDINDTYGTTIENLKDETKFREALITAYSIQVALMKQEMKAKLKEDELTGLIAKEIDLEEKLTEKINKRIEAATKARQANETESRQGDLSAEAFGGPTMLEIAKLEKELERIKSLKDEILGEIQFDDSLAIKIPVSGKKKKPEDEEKIIDLVNEIKKVKLEAIADEEKRELSLFDLKHVLRLKEISEINATEEQKAELIAAETEKAAIERNAMSERYAQERADKEFELAKDNLNEFIVFEKMMAQQRFLDGKMSAEDYHGELQRIDEEFLEAKLVVFKDYGADTLEIEQQILDGKLVLMEEELAAQERKYEEMNRLADQWGRNATDAVSYYFDFHEIGTNKQTTKENKRHQLAVDTLNNRLKTELISEEEYNKELEKLNEDHRKKEAKIKRTQWENQKAADIAQAVINTAVGVTKSIPNIPLMVLAAAAGGLQVAKIASTPTPIFAKGTVLRGPSHEQGGINLTDSHGNFYGNAEGDEILMTKGVYRSPIGRKLASDLNAAFGGVRFDNAVMTSTPKFDLGGVTKAIEYKEIHSSGDSLKALSDVLVPLTQLLQNGIEARIPYDRLDFMLNDRDNYRMNGKLN